MMVICWTPYTIVILIDFNDMLSMEVSKINRYSHTLRWATNTRVVLSPCAGVRETIWEFHIFRSSHYFCKNKWKMFQFWSVRPMPMCPQNIHNSRHLRFTFPVRKPNLHFNDSSRLKQFHTIISSLPGEMSQSGLSLLNSLWVYEKKLM